MLPPAHGGLEGLPELREATGGQHPHVPGLLLGHAGVDEERHAALGRELLEFIQPRGFVHDDHQRLVQVVAHAPSAAAAAAASSPRR